MSDMFRSAVRQNGKIALLLFAFCIVNVISCTAQTGLVPDKYLKITPGVSSREDVERLYSARDHAKYFVDYDLKEYSIGIAYSQGPCSLKLSWLGLPEWTVEKIYINWPDRTKMRLSDVILDKKRFEKHQKSDVLSDLDYDNDEFGVSITFDNRHKLVSSMTIEPSAKLQREYACQ